MNRIAEAKATIANFCLRHNISAGKQADIHAGFDLTQPLYVHKLYPPERIFQYIRMPSAMNVCPSLGNWFALRGATMAGVAVFSGLAGRRLAEFELSLNIEVLEGTAVYSPRLWGPAVGGPGGLTQIFVPDLELFALRSLGSAEF
jgi:hypothetical protein